MGNGKGITRDAKRDAFRAFEEAKAQIDVKVQ